MCTSSSVLIDKEDMTLGKSCLQLNKHSPLHLYSSRLQCTELYICNIINYLSIKEIRKSKETKVKKKKMLAVYHQCISCSLINTGFTNHCQRRSFISTGMKHNSTVIFLISCMVFLPCVTFPSLISFVSFHVFYYSGFNMLTPQSLIGPHSNHFL